MYVAIQYKPLPHIKTDTEKRYIDLSPSYIINAQPPQLGVYMNAGNVPNVAVVPATAAHIRELGRALAHSKYLDIAFEKRNRFVRINDNTRQISTLITPRGELLRQDYNGRWFYHTRQMQIEAENKIDYGYVGLSWSRYHFLVAMNQGLLPYIRVSQNTEAAYRSAVHSYRLELWKLAGYSNSDRPKVADRTFKLNKLLFN